MQGLYFLAMLLGMVWLCAWAILPEELRRGAWWPFDMRDSDDGSRAAPAPRARAALRRTAPPSHRDHALSQRGAPQSWRLRGKPPAPSARRR